MKTAACLALLLSSLAMVSAAPRGGVRAVSLAEVRRLKAPLTLAGVEKAFGPAQGHEGPLVSYPCADQRG